MNRQRCFYKPPSLMKTHRTLRALLGMAIHLFFHQSHSQQVQLRGRVAMHNSKYQTGRVIYVQNTYLSAPFTKPALSDVNGLFALEFVDLDPGMAIKIEAYKQGLEIVNTRDLDEVVIGRKVPLRIYVTEKGNLAKAQTELYKVSQQALFASRDQMIARLRGEKAQSEAAIEELQKRFGQALKDRFAAEDLLRKKVDEQQKQLPKFAVELAKKNLDNASSLYIQAYELFQEGKILEVIALLDEEKLQASRQQTKQGIAAIKKEKALLALREEQNQQQIQQLIATFTLKADALALEFRYAEIATQYREIIDIHIENDLAKKDLARWYDRLGQVLLDNGTYEPAIKAYQKALTIREEVLDATHPSLAISYNNIGSTYFSMGRHEESLVFHQKALAIYEEVLDATHPSLAISYNNIGLTYWSMGRYEESLVFYQKALAIYEEVLDATHPALASSYNNIAGTYWSMGRYEESLVFHQKALFIREEVLDATHPALARSYNNIAGTYGSMGHYKKALFFHQKALAISKEVLDKTHPNLARSYNNIGATLIGLQQYKAAQESLQKALTIFKENKHPQIITTYGHMGLLQLKLGNASKAQEYFSLYNELAKAKYREKDKALGSYYQALYHTVIGDLQKALCFLEEAVAKGYQNKVGITQEELLAPLYKEPRYQVLVEKFLGKENNETSYKKKSNSL